MRNLVFFIFTIIVIISCNDSDSGCPGNEIMFAERCYDQPLIYFGGPRWFCGHDSMALEIDTVDKVIRNEYFSDGSSGHFAGWFSLSKSFYLETDIILGQGCQNYSDHNFSENVYWRIDNLDEIENLPDELYLTGLLIDGLLSTDHTILDSTKVTLFKENRR